MRILLVMLLSAVLGALVGVALGYVEVRPWSAELAAPEPAVVAPGELTDAADVPGPRVEVDEPEYEFGEMERGTKKTHDFVFRNVGTAPLTLESGATTCKCALSEVPDEPVPPGGSAKVRMEWKAQAVPGPFRQTATITTNDPLTSSVSLTVSGEVTEATGVYPPDLLFDKIRYGEVKTAEVYIMTEIDEPLEVGNPTFGDPALAEYFTVDIEPVEPQELPTPDAKQGCRIRVTTKPGLPLGRFDQWLAVTTNRPAAETMEIPIIGRVVGSVSIYGRNWSDERNELRLGTVSSSEGARAELSLIVRGDAAADAHFEVASCDPPELVVSFGEPKQLTDVLTHVPLVIEVPAGTRPMVRMATIQGDAGHIVLKSTLSDAPELEIHVRFAVQR